MKLQTVKKASQIQLAGIRVETEYRDASLQTITLFDASGNMLRVTGSYGISAMIPAPPAMVKRHRLSGKFGGLIEVCEDFVDEYSAKQRLSEYDNKHSGARGDLGLAISTVEVPEEE